MSRKFIFNRNLKVGLEGKLRLHSSVCSATFETKGQFCTLSALFRIPRSDHHQGEDNSPQKYVVTDTSFNLGHLEDSWPWTRLSFAASVWIRSCYLFWYFWISLLISNFRPRFRWIWTDRSRDRESTSTKQNAVESTRHAKRWLTLVSCSQNFFILLCLFI